jgi:hypothetical protein
MTRVTSFPSTIELAESPPGWVLGPGRRQKTLLGKLTEEVLKREFLT